MNFEICKNCVSYREGFSIHFGCSLPSGISKSKIVPACVEISSWIDSVLRYHCFFDCDILVEGDFFIRSISFPRQPIGGYRVLSGKENEFFGLIKNFSGRTLLYDDLPCPYFLEHQLYDWNL